MIGVVLWSDISDRKAVIWCEDQGDLAFLNSNDDFRMTGGFFDAGDVVQFDMEVRATMRRVHNPRLVAGRAGTALPDALRNTVVSRKAGRPSAQIIPFIRRSAKNQIDLPRASEA